MFSTIGASNVQAAPTPIIQNINLTEAQTQALLKALILLMYELEMGDLLEELCLTQNVFRTDGEGYTPGNPPQMTALEYANSVPGAGAGKVQLTPGGGYTQEPLVPGY
jgi:hypothetical protein